jgi:hypothetical protein
MIPKSLNNPELNLIRRKYQAVMKKLKEPTKKNKGEVVTKQVYDEWLRKSKC